MLLQQDIMELTTQTNSMKMRSDFTQDFEEGSTLMLLSSGQAQSLNDSKSSVVVMHSIESLRSGSLWNYKKHNETLSSIWQRKFKRNLKDYFQNILMKLTALSMFLEEQMLSHALNGIGLYS